MTFTEFRENLLIGLYQDDSLSGDWHDLSEIQSKYGLQGDMKLLSLAAKHLAADGNIDLRELVGAAIQGRLTGAGMTYIEQKYGDKDGVGSIIEPASDIDGAPAKIVPASDRIVTLSDNHRLELENSTSRLLTELQAVNAVDGDVLLRERFLAQLSAARELVRSHSVRAYLFYQLVVEVLLRLVSTYGKTGLGVAAAKLLELYIEYLVKG